MKKLSVLEAHEVHSSNKVVAASFTDYDHAEARVLDTMNSLNVLLGDTEDKFLVF